MTLSEAVILKKLQSQGFLTNPGRTHLVLAYSGGTDSTVLLNLLAKLSANHHLQVTAAYYHHAWRGETPEELPLIHKNTDALGIPLVVLSTDPTAGKNEADARLARYRELNRLAENIGADAILTAHHADDQLETLLFRLFRGTGVDGLTGIHERLVLKRVPILRPMLDITRPEIEQYVKENHLNIFQDPTNQDSKYQRNALRKDIIPVIQARFPEFRAALNRLADITAGDAGILEDAVSTLRERLTQKTGPDKGIDTIAFNQLSRPYQRRLIKHLLEENEIETDFKRIEEIIDFVQGKNRSNLNTSLLSLTSDEESGRRFLSIYKNRLNIVKVGKTLGETSTGIPVTVPGEVYFEPLNMTISIEEIPQKTRGQQVLKPLDSWEVLVDLSRFRGFPLELRTRRPGDKIHAFGMQESMRFKKFLINRGVPRFERDMVPLLATGRNVLWAVGLGLSEDLRVENNPTHRLSIVLDRKPPKLVTEEAPEPSGGVATLVADSGNDIAALKQEADIEELEAGKETSDDSNAKFEEVETTLGDDDDHGPDENN